jgi:hypothetical protein
MSTTKGTPKTLAQAIHNGLEDRARVAPGLCDSTDVAALHVRDFIAQKFSTAILQNPEAEKVLQELFEVIVK